MMMKKLTGKGKRAVSLIAALALLCVCCSALIGCGGEKNPPPEAHVHTLEKTEAVEATCQAGGTKEYYTCTGCKKIFADGKGETETTLDALKTEKLAHAYELIVEVAKKNYYAGDTLSVQDLKFTLKCNEGKEERELSEGVTVDLSAPLAEGPNRFTAKYTADGKEISKPFTVTAGQAQHRHVLEKVDAKAAACNKEGNIEYYVCECGKLFSSESGENEITADSVIIAKIPHAYALEVSVAGGTYYAGDTLPANAITFAVACSVCGESYQTSGNITVDLSAPLELGANAFYAVYSDGTIELSKTFTVNAVEKKLTVSLKDLSACYHDGGKITKPDLVVRVVDNGSENVTEEYTIVNDALFAPATVVKVSCNGVTVSVNVDVKELTFVAEEASTTEVNGTAAHYLCSDCGKLFDLDKKEIIESDLTLPLMQWLDVNDENVSLRAFDGAKVNLSPEQGKTFLSDKSTVDGVKKQAGKMFITYNLSVESDAVVKIYINTCERDKRHKFNDVFSAEFNGQPVTVSDEVEMPYKETGVNWFNHHYTYVCQVELKAGQDNVIELTRIMQNKNRGDYSYNFFGLGVTPIEEGVTVSAAPYTVPPISPKEEVTVDKALPVKVNGTTFSQGVTAVDKDGNTVTQKNSELNISANDSTAKKGLIIITYKITVSEDTAAKFYIKTSSQSLENTLASRYSFALDGADVTVDSSIMMPYHDYDKWNVQPYTFVAELNLTAGEHTIVITRADNTDHPFSDVCGYNFFGIAFGGLSGGSVIDFAA